MEPVRFGSALQMPGSPFPAASLVHFLGNPIPQRQQEQGVWGHREKGAKNSPWKSLQAQNSATKPTPLSCPWAFER